MPSWPRTARACRPSARPLERADLLDGRRLARLLAAQPQERDPRAASVYHPLTYGWLCGELIRRVDGRTAGRLLAEEIAAPLGLELWLGLPARHEPRLSRLRYGAAWGGAAIYAPAPADDELLRAIWANPPLFPPADEPLPWNERAFHAAEIGGANAVGSARAVARLYGCLARGGAIDGLWLLSPETLTRGLAEQVRFEEPFAGDQLVYGIGFQLQNDAHAFGPPTEAFGHTGAGGSVHGGWPRERVGFSYAMNELRDLPDGDPRAPRAAGGAARRAAGGRGAPRRGGGVSAPVALVTGAAGGIGARRSCERLAADGFDVARGRPARADRRGRARASPPTWTTARGQPRRRRRRARAASAASTSLSPTPACSTSRRSRSSLEGSAGPAAGAAADEPVPARQVRLAGARREPAGAAGRRRLGPRRSPPRRTSRPTSRPSTA